jgi:outer membrane immunogenic protein
LPYATGGVAFGNFDYESRLHNVNTSGADFYLSGDQVEDTNVGWFVGGGMQWAFTDHWSVRFQYEYIDLGDVSLIRRAAPPSSTFRRITTRTFASTTPVSR